MSRITEALEAADETKALLIEVGAIEECAGLFNEQFPGKKAIIVADMNGFKILGEKVSEKLSLAGITQDKPFIFDDQSLYAEYTFVEKLQHHLQHTDAIPLAVGSGTINDITKLASHLTSRQYMCVATAASMDGYTAFGASITADGAKQTFNCPAPKVCLADIDIIADAPVEMTAAGYADLFAKITAGADWILADALEVEPIDQKSWSIVQDGLHEALSDPDGIRQGNPGAISKLVEGLMLGGFAMQSSKSSRPASGAEHQFSHLWNMEHHLNDGQQISHGFQVSIGTLAITALYEVMLDTDFSSMDIERAVRNWPTPEELETEALNIFNGTDFPLIGVQETKAKYISKDGLRIQLENLQSNWPEISKKLSSQLVPYKDAKNRLEKVGAPTEPEHIGLTRERLRETFIRAQYIRRRFTILDVAVRTGYLSIWLDQLFGKGGIWETQS